jgi:hypothetical protein
VAGAVAVISVLVNLVPLVEVLAVVMVQYWLVVLELQVKVLRVVLQVLLGVAVAVAVLPKLEILTVLVKVETVLPVQ